MKNVRYILIFCLSLLLFNWPVLSIAGSMGKDIFFLYLFSAWIFIIALIFVNGLTRSDLRNDLTRGQTVYGPGSAAENSADSTRKGENIGNPDRAGHV